MSPQVSMDEQGSLVIDNWLFLSISISKRMHRQIKQDRLV
jgi:hypothetical protein